MRLLVLHEGPDKRGRFTFSLHWAQDGTRYRAQFFFARPDEYEHEAAIDGREMDDRYACDLAHREIERFHGIDLPF